MNLLIHKLNKNAIIPKYATEKSACFDIHACLDINSKIKAYESQDFPYMVENKEKSTTLKYTEKYGLIIQPNLEPQHRFFFKNISNYKHFWSA